MKEGSSLAKVDGEECSQPVPWPPLLGLETEGRVSVEGLEFSAGSQSGPEPSHGLGGSFFGPRARTRTFAGNIQRLVLTPAGLISRCEEFDN